MSVIIIGTGGHNGGHKAIKLLKDNWNSMDKDQQFRAHAIENKFLDDVQELIAEITDED